jgi:hypothetical protein
MTKRIDAMACLRTADERLGWAQRKMDEPGAWTDDPLIFSGNYESALEHVADIQKRATDMQTALIERIRERQERRG